MSENEPLQIQQSRNRDGSTATNVAAAFTQDKSATYTRGLCTSFGRLLQAEFTGAKGFGVQGSVFNAFQLLNSGSCIPLCKRRYPTRSTILVLRAGWRPAAGIAIIALPTATTTKSLPMVAASLASEPVAEGPHCRLVVSSDSLRNPTREFATMNAFRSKVSFDYQSVSNRTATECPPAREASSWFFVGKLLVDFRR
jgi:hypothetical protein